MGTGFSGHRSTRCCPVTSPRQGNKAAVVARRARPRSTTLEVHITFEPSRVSPACVVQAYERVIPITRRPAPRACSPHQAEGTQQRQHVGGRQQA